MSDTIVVMNQGYIQQIEHRRIFITNHRTPFVADFIGDSKFFLPPWWKISCQNAGPPGSVWTLGFDANKPVDAVIRPEDIDLVKPGRKESSKVWVTHLIFKGVHYENGGTLQ